MSRLALALGVPQPVATRLDGAWLTVLAIFIAIALLVPDRFVEFGAFTLGALGSTAPFILFAVFVLAYLKASGAEAVVAKAFQGRETRMIFVAALVGGLAPFCSCEVIPFVAGMLALGTPLPAVMAFWLSSPVMDPAAFAITAGELGWDFAAGKTASAVVLGLMGGFALMALMKTTKLFADPLKPRSGGGCCGCGPSPFQGTPVWRFWREEPRRIEFRTQAAENGLFLLKWLSLAYVLEALMIAYVPAEAIGGVVGGDGVLPVMISALAGVPAYLNGYAAPAITAGLMEQGMSAASAMTFLVAGAVTSIPAMTAVFALVKRDVFAAYIAFALIGAVAMGLLFGVWMG